MCVNLFFELKVLKYKIVNFIDNQCMAANFSFWKKIVTYMSSTSVPLQIAYSADQVEDCLESSSCSGI